MLAIIYGIICASMLMIMLFLYGYSFHALWIGRRYSAEWKKDRWPKAALVIPCRGVEPNLEENLRRHFHHDYPDYRIVFSVARADDPSVPIIRRLIETEKGQASLVVAACLPDCVEKVANQIAAFQSLDPDVEVIVCADSDGLVRDGNWLRALVSALESAALVSGFRWYMPARPSFVGFLQSAFDSTWCLLHALGKTTWGGAMAFTRATYDRLRFEEALRCAITDDLVLLRSTHRAGEQTAFTPGGMMMSEPAHRFMDFFRWAVRQSRTIRLVTPWLYLMGFATANVYACFYGLSLVLLALPDTGLDRKLPAGALGIAALYYLGRGYMDYRLATMFFPDHIEKTASLRWVYYWANPVSDLLAPMIAYASLLSNKIRWRGINYQFKNGRVVRIGPGPAHARWPS